MLKKVLFHMPKARLTEHTDQDEASDKHKKHRHKHVHRPRHKVHHRGGNNDVKDSDYTRDNEIYEEENNNHKRKEQLPNEPGLNIRHNNKEERSIKEENPDSESGYVTNEDQEDKENLQNNRENLSYTEGISSEETNAEDDYSNNDVESEMSEGKTETQSDDLSDAEDLPADSPTPLAYNDENNDLDSEMSEENTENHNDVHQQMSADTNIDTNPSNDREQGDFQQAEREKEGGGNLHMTENGGDIKGSNNVVDQTMPALDGDVMIDRKLIQRLVSILKRIISCEEHSEVTPDVKLETYLTYLLNLETSYEITIDKSIATALLNAVRRHKTRLQASGKYCTHRFSRSVDENGVLPKTAERDYYIQEAEAVSESLANVINQSALSPNNNPEHGNEVAKLENRLLQRIKELNHESSPASNNTRNQEEKIPSVSSTLLPYNTGADQEDTDVKENEQSIDGGSAMSEDNTENQNDVHQHMSADITTLPPYNTGADQEDTDVKENEQSMDGGSEMSEDNTENQNDVHQHMSADITTLPPYNTGADQEDTDVKENEQSMDGGSEMSEDNTENQNDVHQHMSADITTLPPYNTGADQEDTDVKENEQSMDGGSAMSEDNTENQNDVHQHMSADITTLPPYNTGADQEDTDVKENEQSMDGGSEMSEDNTENQNDVHQHMSADITTLPPYNTGADQEDTDVKENEQSMDGGSEMSEDNTENQNDVHQHMSADITTLPPYNTGANQEDTHVKENEQSMNGGSEMSEANTENQNDIHQHVSTDINTETNPLNGNQQSDVQHAEPESEGSGINDKTENGEMYNNENAESYKTMAALSSDVMIDSKLVTQLESVLKRIIACEENSEVTTNVKLETYLTYILNLETSHDTKIDRDIATSILSIVRRHKMRLETSVKYCTHRFSRSVEEDRTLPGTAERNYYIQEAGAVSESLADVVNESPPSSDINPEQGDQTASSENQLLQRIGELNHESSPASPASWTSGWGEWSTWSACSVTCGEGSVERKRHCQTSTCEGYGAETRSCIADVETCASKVQMIKLFVRLGYLCYSFSLILITQ